ARSCQTCTSRTPNATRKTIASSPAVGLGTSVSVATGLREDNGVMLPVVSMSTLNRGGRGNRRQRFSLRVLRSLGLNVGAFLAVATAATAQPRLTFNKDIAPIVWTRCATCHRPGEIGPFDLITYDDVRRHATQIAAVTARRVMPPWKPAPDRGSFQNERRL